METWTPKGEISLPVEEVRNARVRLYDLIVVNGCKEVLLTGDLYLIDPEEGQDNPLAQLVTYTFREVFYDSRYSIEEDAHRWKQLIIESLPKAIKRLEDGMESSGGILGDWEKEDMKKAFRGRLVDAYAHITLLEEKTILPQILSRIEFLQEVIELVWNEMNF